MGGSQTAGYMCSNIQQADGSTAGIGGHVTTVIGAVSSGTRSKFFRHPVLSPQGLLATQLDIYHPEVCRPVHGHLSSLPAFAVAAFVMQVQYWHVWRFLYCLCMICQCRS